MRDIPADVLDEISRWLDAIERHAGMHGPHHDPATPAVQAHAEVRRAIHKERCRAETRAAVARARLEDLRASRGNS